jgi:hypothetical protein
MAATSTQRREPGESAIGAQRWRIVLSSPGGLPIWVMAPV